MFHHSASYSDDDDDDVLTKLLRKNAFWFSCSSCGGRPVGAGGVCNANVATGGAIAAGSAILWRSPDNNVLAKVSKPTQSGERLNRGRTS